MFESNNIAVSLGIYPFPQMKRIALTFESEDDVLRRVGKKKLKWVAKSKSI